MVVGDADLPGGGQANSDGEVGHALSPDLAEIIALVVKHLDTVGSVVADEHLLLVVHGNAIGELEMPAESCA